MQAMGIRLDQTPQADTRARWLQPPRLQTLAEESDRHASWLELFFDLVFVVAITELSGQLVADHSAGGFLRFAALFISGRRGPVGSLARVRHALAVLGLEVLELSLPPLSTRLHRR